MERFLKHIVFLLILLPITLFSYSQSCNITSKANDIIPDKLCAPVTVSWEVTYRGVQDGGAPVEIVYDWDDGNPVEVFAAINTNVSLQEWKYTATHVYLQGGTKCVYRPTATLQVNGVLCTSSIQEQMVTVWDVDTANGGHMEILPDVFPICVGNDGTVTFQDASIFNCVPPVENDNPNETTRWTQWIYGTAYTLNGVLVNGIAETYPDTGAVVPMNPPPIWGPQPPNNFSLPLYAPPTGSVGQFFEVTLRNWNYCNPYDDPNIPGPPADTVNGDYPPVTTTAIILIVPLPDATINPAGPFCENESGVNLSAATAGGTWSGPGITNSNTGHFSPSTAGPGIHEISYSVTDGNGCVGTDTVLITVYAIPSINILPANPATVCPGDNLQLDGNPTPGDGTIITNLWTGDTSPLNATNIQNPLFNTTSQGNYNLTYTVTDDNGCSAADNLTVSVNPVSAHILPNPAEACIGEDLMLHGNPSGGTGNYTIHLWTGETTPLSNTNIENPIFNAGVLDTFHLVYTVTDDNGCMGKDSVDIPVLPFPNAYAGPDDTICGNSYSLSATPSIGIGNWSLLSGTGSANFADNTDPTTTVTVDNYGTYQFVWQEINGMNCDDDDTVAITFFEQPVADAGMPGGICGLSYSINAHPSVGTGMWTIISGPGNGYFTNPSDSATAITVDSYGNYQIAWTETNGICTDADTMTIGFDVVPAPSFLPINPEGCTPYTVTFQNTTQNGVSYSWDLGDGNFSTDTNPTNTYYNPTDSDVTYVVTLIAQSAYGCSDTVSQVLTVHPSPLSDFSFDNTPHCSPMTVDFTNDSEGATHYQWFFNDSTAMDTTTNPTHIFVNDTTFIQYYPVELVAISQYSCTDTSSAFVTVYPNPDPNFQVLPDSACSPATIQLIADPGYMNYEWHYGDGTYEILSSNQPTHGYVNNTQNDSTFHLFLIATSYLGCIDTSYQDLVIFPSPTVGFTSDQTAACSPATITLTNTSTDATQFQWNFGDGNSDTTTATTITHDYTNIGTAPITYSITLVGENNFGCSEFAIKTLLVYPEVKALFDCDTIGCSPLDIDFDNQSSGGNTYMWYFGDGNTSTEVSPSHSYPNTGFSPVNYYVSLIATSVYGCTDTLWQTITVYPSPTANFSVTPTTQTLPNSTVSISNLSSAGNWNYLWTMGDSSTFTTQSPGSYTYGTAGVFTISLVVFNDYCADSISQTITINNAPPIADFSFNPSDGCAPLDVSFTNNSTNGESYLWDFGDGDHSSDESPTHTYYSAGSFQVQLMVTNSGGQDIKNDVVITVYPAPQAYFTVAPSVVSIPDQAIRCFNQSQDAETYLWDFGDGSSSTDEAPNHYYTQEGEYDITLKVWSEHQCPDEYTVHDAVTATAEGQIKFPNAFTPNPSGPNGGIYEENDYSNDVFHPEYKGVVEYELNIFNRWGELIFVSKDPKIGWDGYYRGELCKQDVYVWKVKVKFVNNETITKIGDVTLIR